MADVTLSASVRSSLLSLQNTTDLISRTQGRLSKGLRVAGAVDDPVAFFQSKSLSDRASDFLEKKDGIDQGISTVTAALDGVEGIENLVKQMKGIANSMKSATAAQISDLVTQFNDLKTQINNLAADSTYQGTNLINGTGQTLTVEFSEKTASLLNISSVDLRAGTAGLALNAAAGYTGDDSVTHAAISLSAKASNTFKNRFLTTTSDFSITYQGSKYTFAAGDTVSFTYGTGSTFNFRVGTASALTVTQGGVLDVDIVNSLTGIGAGKELALLTTGSINAVFGYSAKTFTATTGTENGSITLTYNGTSKLTLTTADNGVVFTVGTKAVTLTWRTTGSTIALSQGKTVVVEVINAATASGGLTGAYYINIANNTGYAITATTASNTLVKGLVLGGGLTRVTANGGELTFTGLVKAGDTTKINALITQLDTALTTLRTKSQTLGSNVALLNTRLDFTENYVNTLTIGADKLTLADINEEGANLLALQTRQQLGIQALSLAAQAEASILQLFG